MAKRSKKRRQRTPDAPAPIPKSQPAASSPGRDWPSALGLVLAVFIVYIPVWRAGFIWDDNILITGNPVIVGPLGFAEIWTTKAADICPLTISTFWLEHQLWGLNPLPYHLVNIAVHAACAILLWRVLRAMRIPGAWLGAALWSLHPVMVESVAWITEMKNTESTLFFLLAILFFLKDAKSNPTRWSTHYLLALLFSALALAAKSSTVILPIVLCLAAWWNDRRWQWSHAIKVAPILLMSVIASLVSIHTQRLGGGADPQWIQPWPDRLVIAGSAVWFYLGKLIWPDPLIFIYHRWAPQAATVQSWLPLGAILFFLWLGRDKSARPWFFPFAYFLVALLPVLGFVPLFFSRYSYVADHFQYLAAMAPMALAGAAIATLAKTLFPASVSLRSALGACILLIFGCLSWQRAFAFQAEEKLWTDTLVKNPDCWVGQNNLGLILMDQGHLDEAINHCQQAIRLNSNYADPHNTLGIALYQKGQPDEALTHWQKAIEINPDYAEPHNSIANYFLQKGQLTEAVAEYQKALEIKPRYPEAHYNLGMALMNKGQLDQAIPHLQAYTEIRPDDPTGHNTLGFALYQNHQSPQAITEFQTALRLKPGDPAIQENLTKAQGSH